MDQGAVDGMRKSRRARRGARAGTRGTVFLAAGTARSKGLGPGTGCCRNGEEEAVWVERSAGRGRR